jgi:hypothetical protein
MALSAPRNTSRRGSHVVEEEGPVKTNVVLWNGGIGATDGTGFIVPGAASTALKAPGMIHNDNLEGKVDSTGVASGVKRTRIKYGIFNFKSGTSGDAIAVANREADCYIIDDETVGLTDGGGTRSKAGKIVDVDADGVWVSMQRP